ncbi:MAG: DUF3656 domain-containing protein [Oscillospiraceae bacterium]
MNEILAPCGSIDSLYAALNAGADAIYIGMKKFSARKNAENFSDLELKQAVIECHKRGVKVYAAMNTLVYDSEFSEFAECVKTAAECGVDALIVQDLGAVRIIRSVCPDLPIHASTQMTLNSVSGVKAAEELGFSRVVIGRELSSEEISKIASEAKSELEVFVHGALCVSVSGQCYMSSIFGGRSGNRGLCAQPCRLDFSCGERHNVISLKDQSLISHLGELKNIKSFKIEGRMKRPEYVACAVDACRKALSGTLYDEERLSNVFSRGGLTEGYFSGEMRDMNGIREKEDVDNSSKALVGIKEIYKAEYPRIPLNISVEIFDGKPLRAVADCEYGSVEIIFDIVPEPASGKPLDEASVCDRMGKLGGTQFLAGKITASVGEGLYVAASALNALRRSVCDAMTEKVLEKCSPNYKINEFVLPKSGETQRGKPLKLRAEIYSAEQLNKALSLDFEKIYAPIGLLDKDTDCNEKIIAVPPLVLNNCEDEVRDRLLKLKSIGFTKGLAHTLAHAELLRECGFEIHGGYRMNVLNSLSAAALSDYGFSDIVVSFEGTHDALSKIQSAVPKGILAYGRIPLMLMRRCPIANGKPCCKKSAFGEGQSCNGSLIDRRGNKLPVLCGGNCVELLNPDVLILSDKREVMQSFDFCILKFTTESESEVESIYNMYTNNGKPKDKLTRGLYFRGAE